MAPQSRWTTLTLGVHSYGRTTSVQVVATAGASYVLDHWTGNVTDHNAVTSMVVMDRDNTVTTYFSEMPPILGDVNGDEGVDSTGTLIIRSCDVDVATSPYCPMNCGDVNAGGAINSTDALVVLSYEVGMTVPYSPGDTGCPSGVTACAGGVPWLEFLDACFRNRGSI